MFVRLCALVNVLYSHIFHYMITAALSWPRVVPFSLVLPRPCLVSLCCTTSGKMLHFHFTILLSFQIIACQQHCSQEKWWEKISLPPPEPPVGRESSQNHVARGYFFFSNAEAARSNDNERRDEWRKDRKDNRRPRASGRKIIFPPHCVGELGGCTLGWFYAKSWE